MPRAPIAHASQHEGDEHGGFAPDTVGDPAEERPRQTVEHIVDDQRQRQHRAGDAKDGDL